MSEYYVYTLRDTEGRAAYIGMTKNLIKRIATHRRRHAWFHYADHDGPYTREEAMRRERALIRLHQPTYNTRLKDRDDMVPLALVLTRRQHDALRTRAEQEDRSMSYFARKALDRFFGFDKATIDPIAGEKEKVA